MNRAFYALNHAEPTLTVRNVGFFDVWSAMTKELAHYYSADQDSFDLFEACWNEDHECAEVVTLNSRVIGALNRCLTQDDVRSIWGFNRMEKHAFANRIRSLFNIDSHLLRELSGEQQSRFLADPVRFFLNATEEESDVVMREIEARQTKAESKPVAPTVEKSSRTKRRKPGLNGQRELLLPITGGAATKEPASPPNVATKKAG